MTKPRKLAARFGDRWWWRPLTCCTSIVCNCGGDWTAEAFNDCPKFEHHLAEMTVPQLNDWSDRWALPGNGGIG